VAQDFDFEQRIDYDMQPGYEDVSETEGPQQADDEDDNNFMERRSEWVEENGRLILPDIKLPLKPLREPKKLSLREQKHGLQVIIKLSSIELTLRKPEYRGEVWHGQMVSVAFFDL